MFFGNVSKEFSGLFWGKCFKLPRHVGPYVSHGWCQWGEQVWLQWVLSSSVQGDITDHQYLKELKAVHLLHINFTDVAIKISMSRQLVMLMSLCWRILTAADIDIFLGLALFFFFQKPKAKGQRSASYQNITSIYYIFIDDNLGVECEYGQLHRSSTISFQNILLWAEVLARGICDLGGKRSECHKNMEFILWESWMFTQTGQVFGPDSLLSTTLIDVLLPVEYNWITAACQEIT